MKDIKIKGAREHNLKDVSINLPREKFVVITGLSGSGKSTFLKILSGEIDPDEGSIALNPNERVAMLQQDQFAFDEQIVLDTVMMGYN